uniref:Uncharacterized protein n=1 Tax=Arundo donax TaxID=35708 RepID=A0A0A9ALR7_ARUDO
MKDLHSVASSMTPKILGPLPTPTGVAPERPSYPDTKGSDAETSGVSPQSQPPSMLRELSARSMAPHLRIPSMVPHLRVPSKMSQVHVQSVMLQAEYSGAKTMIHVNSTPPLLSAPKGHATSPSTEELKHHQLPGLDMKAKDIECAAPIVALKSPDSTAAILTTEGQKDSTLKSMVSSNQAATLAADALLALSGPDEKGR